MQSQRRPRGAQRQHIHVNIPENPYEYDVDPDETDGERACARSGVEIILYKLESFGGNDDIMLEHVLEPRGRDAQTRACRRLGGWLPRKCVLERFQADACQPIVGRPRHVPGRGPAGAPTA